MFSLDTAEDMADEPTGAGQPAADPAPAPKAKAADTAKADAIAAIIRNGLSDSALSRDAAAWDALETRLPQIAAAIMKEP